MKFQLEVFTAALLDTDPDVSIAFDELISLTKKAFEELYEEHGSPKRKIKNPLKKLNVRKLFDKLIKIDKNA